MLKEIIVILLSSFKFAMTFPLAIMGFEMNFLETIIWTNIGGIIGVFIFTFLSEQIIFLWGEYIRPQFKIKLAPKMNSSPTRKRIFTRRNRRIIRIKDYYGLAGIALATPVLLSIPVGAFLTVRYFKRKNEKLIFLILANVLWSFIYATFYLYFYHMWQDLTG